MRRVHPLWRGFWLAVALTAARVLVGGVDELAALRLNRRAMALAAAMLLGALVVTLPRLLRKHREKTPRPTWKRCLTAAGCGGAMALGCGLAGSGRILPALAEGSIGGYAFVLAAWIAGFVAVRVAGRRRRA